METVYRGEDGSPYTLPNPGETMVRLKGETIVGRDEEIDWVAEEEEWAARKQAKALKAQRRRAGPAAAYRS